MKIALTDKTLITDNDFEKDFYTDLNSNLINNDNEENPAYGCAALFCCFTALTVPYTFVFMMNISLYIAGMAIIACGINDLLSAVIEAVVEKYNKPSVIIDFAAVEPGFKEKIVNSKTEEGYQPIALSL